MICAKCKGPKDPGSLDELCDDCSVCLDCGRTGEEADIEHGLCDRCWAEDMRVERTFEERRC